MNTLTHLAAPAQAPNLGSGQAVGGGAVLIGIVILAVTLSHWKKIPKQSKLLFFAGLICTLCLVGGGGILGGMLNTIKQTAETTGTTLQTTTIGQ